RNQSPTSDLWNEAQILVGELNNLSSVILLSDTLTFKVFDNNKAVIASLQASTEEFTDNLWVLQDLIDKQFIDMIVSFI
ncbi:MAG: hypothetical protein KAJ15_07690, partial [Spirochaetes bacterium]|nr:hypothetical protein [Spirochaetota bacterium]